MQNFELFIELNRQAPNFFSFFCLRHWKEQGLSTSPKHVTKSKDQVEGRDKGPASWNKEARKERAEVRLLIGLSVPRSAQEQ